MSGLLLHSRFSRAATFMGIHFACNTEIGWINHFAADKIAGENDRIKFPAARDAELSYGFVRELIMFRNRRPGDREQYVHTYMHGGALCVTKESERERGGGRERERERERESATEES